MRGSPLLRTLTVLIALLVTGIGLAKLTAPAARIESDPPPANEASRPAADVATFELLLSGPAKRVTLDAGGEPVTFENTAGPVTGKLALAGEALFLKVEWAGAATGHRFARVRLEAPGQETREHVFSAPGDIDDLWEP